MEDTNKSKRIYMWVAFVVSLISIPLFIYVDNKQLTESDLLTIDNLVLSENSRKVPGGKGSSPSLRFKFTNTERAFLINSEEYQCVSNSNILKDFKKGDTVSIKISRSDKEDFFETTWFDKVTKLYGLSTKGKNYLLLSCRNNISNRWAGAATAASIVTAISSFIFATFIFKRKTKYQAYGQFPIDPTIVIAIVWFTIFLIFR